MTNATDAPELRRHITPDGRLYFSLSLCALWICCPSCEQPDHRGPGKLKPSVSQLHEQIRTMEWRRHDPEQRLITLLADTRVEVRHNAVRAIGRLDDTYPGATRALERALGDTAPTVRAAAAFALGSLWMDRPESRSRPHLARVRAALRLGLSRESDAAATSSFLWALGWLGEIVDLKLIAERFHRPPIARRKASPISDPKAKTTPTDSRTKSQREPPRRDLIGEAALASWGILARGLKPGQSADIGPLIPVLESGSIKQQELAAWALANATVQKLNTAQWALLTGIGSRSPSKIVRAGLTRACGHQLSRGRPAQIWLLAQLKDTSAEVRVEAASALGRAGVWAAVKLSRALLRLWRAASMSHNRLTGPPLRPVLAGIAALERHAQVPTINLFATEMLELADASDSAVKYGEAEALSIDLIHCAAARLYDLGIRRIERSATCGTARSKAFDPAWRKARVVSVISAMARDPRWKLTMLRRYLKDPRPDLRAVALGALVRVNDSGRDAALSVGVGDLDGGVFKAAATVLGRQVYGAPQKKLAQLVGRRLTKINTLKDPEAACAAVSALSALGNRDYLPLLAKLYRRPASSVRRCVESALTSTHHSVPNTRPFSRGLPDLRWAGPEGGQKLPTQAILVTDKGEAIIQLLPHRCPVAVARFASLAVKRAFRGTRLSQPLGEGLIFGGSLRLDGYNGPVFRIPDERDRHQRVTVGSMGFEAVGRDSAGQNFFISLARQPQLDGRRTLFARVIKGFSMLQRLKTGDRIKDLYIPSKPRAVPSQRKVVPR